jgi:hypothetical protein
LKKHLRLIVTIITLIFTPLSFSQENQDNHLITVTQCACSNEEMMEMINLMAAAEQKVLFTYLDNLEMICGSGESSSPNKINQNKDEE